MYARVSKAHTDIKERIRNWGASIAKPPTTYPGCVDNGGFYDIDGVKFNCMWYGKRRQHCMRYGKYFAHVNVTASMACCACGGGKEVLIQSTTTTPPQSTRTPPRGKRDIFLDIQDFQENDFNEEIMFIEEEVSANVTPSIVGGTEVDPPRKYKVCRCMCLGLMHVLWW